VFFNLITVFAFLAWCQLGKIQDPVDDKIKKDLKVADNG
jgi:hypothetical protein